MKKIMVRGCLDCPYKVRLPERRPDEYRAICAHYSLEELNPVWSVNEEYVHEMCRLQDDETEKIIDQIQG
jgi:hypothetical protein